jgi:hypothetical protein
MHRIFRNKVTYYQFLFLTILLSFLSSVITLNFERNTNSDFDEFSEMIFWWVGTLTTIGSGGHPITLWGEVFGVTTMLLSSFMYLAVFTEIILWLKTLSDQRFVGLRKYSGSNHIVIVGYNSLAVALINFLARVVRSDIDIVLLTSAIDANPDPDRVEFVKVNPATSGALEKASISKAHLAFVLSHDEVSDKKSDLNALLIAGMIEESQRHVYTMIEVANEKNVKEKDMDRFNIDAEFTFLELLNDSKNDPKDSKILKKIPKAIRKEVLREEYISKSLF